MADDDHGSSPHTNRSAATRYSSASAPRSRLSYQSNGGYDTGESSRSASGLQESLLTGDTTLQSGQDGGQPHEATDGRRVPSSGLDAAQRKRRSHKPRSSGGFLLSNPIFEKTRQPRDSGRRRSSKAPLDVRRGKSPLSAPDRTDSELPTTFTRGSASPRGERTVSSSERPDTAAQMPVSRGRTSLTDADSAQIVNMALNLSESRRIAQRRITSNPLPPRLAPVPDTPAGGGLKQHLQQQRRTSRTISPTPEVLAPRNVSASQPGVNSPLQATFDTDGGYTYHFSPSTLNRAQNAKEHFELMAQYRRLLRLVPPFKNGALRTKRSSTSSPPASPIASSSTPNSFKDVQSVQLGRPYNPLQYIRNRKVRARERKAVDGEAQGFADVNKVADWVDQAATLIARSPSQPGSPAVPPFPGAHGAGHGHLATASGIPSPPAASSKTKRPRMDWAIDPPDLLADLYWVEQDDNKSLIEDRHYNRIFPPQSATLQRPTSQRTDDSCSKPLLGAASRKDLLDESDASTEPRHSDSNAVSRTETDVSHTTSARERARQKLHDIRGIGAIHHKHSSSSHSHHDLLRLRKASFSDTSDSGSDRRLRTRKGTISTDGKAILEKQMNEILAQEAKDQQSPRPEDVDMTEEQAFRLPVPVDRASEFPPRTQRGRDPVIEDAEVMRRTRQASPIHSGRTSLEVPGYNHRTSMDSISSYPNSPELRARQGSNFIPGIGMDLSPPGSRPGSPMRNPFSKVRSIFRDRSRDRDMRHVPEENEDIESPIDFVDHQVSSPISVDRPSSPERQRSRSRVGKIGTRPPTDSHKSHKRVGSSRLEKDEHVGIRGIFKGNAKIDDIIRGGVSRVSDFLWKKEAEVDLDGTSDSSSDESDAEQLRGRAGKSARSLRSQEDTRRPQETREGKNYLDIMPAFKSASDAERPASHDVNPLIITVDSPKGPSHPNRRSARFDRLKPPRIDVESASSGASPVPSPIRLGKDSDQSDTDSRSRDSAERPATNSSQANTALSPPPFAIRHQSGSSSAIRHWSISDRVTSPQHASQLSKREVARIRALVLSSGIKAMEIARRAREPHPLHAPATSKALGAPWADMARFASAEQAAAAVPPTEAYATAARLLAASVEASTGQLEQATHRFVDEDMRQLRHRVGALHAHVATDLIDLTRRAADDADECSRDLVDNQRLKVKYVLDFIDKMLRRRRRRLRWVRRAGWLAVEWVVVGFMWYVWFLVMIARVFLGVGGAVVAVGRWLLCL